ncbi:RDD family protein [Tenacibaculum aiptasiae]|uniref:RDD family protein n=1 Tax=Tenacibaculum aiptasiae TaxID=426481 RepID=UPI0023305D6C|nr:RDD family protein [Tenacibaculum aiptasiae]
MTQIKQETKGALVEILIKIVNSNKRVRRISSMLLDFFFFCFFIIPLIIIASTISEYYSWKLSFQTENLFFYLIIFIYFNKDFLRGKSPAKRLLGYQIINQETSRQATELQCFIRNLTITIAWPLEVIISFINIERRIGDLIANTKVIQSEKEEFESIWIDFKNTKLKPNLIGIICIGIIYFYELSLLF